MGSFKMTSFTSDSGESEGEHKIRLVARAAEATLSGNGDRNLEKSLQVDY